MPTARKKATPPPAPPPINPNDPRIESWDIEKLLPYARNAKLHGEQQVAEIAASIKAFGFNNPVLIRTTEAGELGEIIAGHGRVLAARKLGRTHVPCIRLDHLTALEARAYRIADNRLAEKSPWDFDVLGLELTEIRDLGLDVELTGFSLSEIDDMLAAEEEPPPAPDPLPTSESTIGQIWTLGPHRLMCGDATNAEHVAALLDGAAPHICVTDPPYGVELDSNWRMQKGMVVGAQTEARATILNDDRADWGDAWKLFPGDVIYAWHSGRHIGAAASALERHNFEIRAQLIWAKNKFPISRGHYHWQHEPCFYAVRNGGKSHWRGDRKQSTVWHIDHLAKLTSKHQNEKPVECMRRPIRNSSKVGDAVYEPFAGSGSTLVACHETERVCYAMELDPRFCDVIVRRYEALTSSRGEAPAGAH